MLRVTVSSEPDLTTVKLEGKLVSVWVDEAGKFTDKIVSKVRRAQVAVDLTDVTFIDEAGKRLLAALANEGVRLISDAPLIDAIVSEIGVRNGARATTPATAKPARTRNSPRCTSALAATALTKIASDRQGSVQPGER
jgi:hypothetical protein